MAILLKLIGTCLTNSRPAMHYCKATPPQPPGSTPLIKLSTFANECSGRETGLSGRTGRPSTSTSTITTSVRCATRHKKQYRNGKRTGCTGRGGTYRAVRRSGTGQTALTAALREGSRAGTIMASRHPQPKGCVAAMSQHHSSQSSVQG